MKIRLLLPKVRLATVLEDFRNFTFKAFIQERYYIHFFVNAVITAFAVYPLAVGFFVTIIAVFREKILFSWGKARFSWEDIRWTFYGCVFVFILKFILCIMNFDFYKSIEF